MDKYTIELVETVEEVREQLLSIYRREVNKMDADLKTKVKTIQDIRLRLGWIQSNNTNWSCPDCIYTVLGHSVIPFIESPKYAGLLAELEVYKLM